MPPSWVQRLLTVATGAGLVIAGALVPGAEQLLAIGGIVCGWALKHPADRASNGEKKP